jgi:hypothetical protein
MCPVGWRFSSEKCLVSSFSSFWFGTYGKFVSNPYLRAQIYTNHIYTHFHTHTICWICSQCIFLNVHSFRVLPDDRSTASSKARRSVASCLDFQYPLVSLRSSSSCLRHLASLTTTCIIPSVTCFRRQFLREMWQIQLAFLLFYCRYDITFLLDCT